MNFAAGILRTLDDMKGKKGEWTNRNQETWRDAQPSAKVREPSFWGKLEPVKDRRGCYQDHMELRIVETGVTNRWLQVRRSADCDKNGPIGRKNRTMELWRLYVLG